MKISLVIPCYNEETNIQKGVLDRIGNFTKKDSRFQEIIVVDDGSTDNSKEIIKNKYLKIFPKFRLIENRHTGKAGALIAGIKNAKGTHVMFTDIDLATPLEEADKLISEAGNKIPIVIGSRNAGRKGAPILRKLMAVGFIVIRNILIGLGSVKDTQCGFKLFETAKANEIVDKLRVSDKKRGIKGSSVSAGFDLEFLFLANKLHYKIKEVPVTWRHVETKNVSFIKDSLESLRDMFFIKYNDFLGRYK